MSADSNSSQNRLDEELFQVRHHALLRAILNNISEGVSIADATGAWVYQSAFAKWVFDAAQPAKEPETWTQRHGIFRSDGQTVFPLEELPVWRALQGEEVRDVDMLVRNANAPQGMHIRISCLPIHDEQGGLLGAMALTRSIDKERRSEADKRRSEKRFQQLVETAHEGVWTIDAQGRTTYANRFMAQLLGYTVEEMKGKTPFEFMAEENRQRAEDSLAQRSQGSSEVLEFPFLRKDGSVLWTSVSASPLFDEEGRYAGALAMISDITRRREAEEEVRRLNAELERRIADRTAQLEFSNRELEAFAYTVAHDLRAPLRSIASFSEAITEDCPGQLDALGQDYLKRIRGGARRMAELIDGILTLSRVNSTALVLRECDLSELARSILEQLQAQQPERRVRLKLQQGLVDRGDPQLLRTVLENLLGNAWKFTRERPEAEIELSATTDERGLRTYQVRDNGAGFDMTFRDKLFGVFQRLHTQQEFEGTGVGLATVQRIVRRHGGRVWGEGQPGHGASFRFTLHEFPLPPGTTASPQKK
jgi:PAS domain S-box-containing protein